MVSGSDAEGNLGVTYDPQYALARPSRFVLSKDRMSRDRERFFRKLKFI